MGFNKGEFLPTPFRTFPIVIIVRDCLSLMFLIMRSILRSVIIFCMTISVFLLFFLEMLEIEITINQYTNHID